MKKLMLTVVLALASAPAFASEPVRVPEMDVGAGLAALALVAGLAAIIREKTRK